MELRRRARTVAALVAAVLAAASLVSAGVEPSSAEAATRAVAVSAASGLEGWDVVTVKWTGFPPNEAVTISQYGRNGPIPWNRVPARSDADGAGESAFTIGLRPDGCLGDDDCWLTVSTCAGAAADGSWGFTHWTTPTGAGWASVRLTIAEQPVLDEEDEPVNPALRPPPAPDPPDDPVRTAPVVTRPVPSVTSGTSQAALLEAWRDDLLFPPAVHPLNLDITPINSPSAMEDLVAGDVDVAVVATAPSTEDLAALAAKGRPAVVIPIVADGLVLAHDRRGTVSEDTSGFDLRELSPASAAALLAGGGGSTLNDRLARDNRACDISSRVYTTANDTQLVFRSDRSAANHLVQSWLVGSGLLAGPPSHTIDLGTGTFIGVNGGDETVVRFLKKTEPGDVPLATYRRIGYLSRSTAHRAALATFDLRTASGEIVVAGPETFAAALDGLTLGPTGVEGLDPAKVADGGWPLTFVSYAVVPTTLDARFTSERAAVLRDYLAHGLSEKGQQRAAELGYTRLPPTVQKEALDRVARIGMPVSEVTTTSVPPPVNPPDATPGPGAGAGAEQAAVPPAGAAEGAGPGVSPTTTQGAQGASAGPSRTSPGAARETGPEPARTTARGSRGPGEAAGARPEGDGSVDQPGAAAPALTVVASRLRDLLAPGWSPGTGILAAFGALALMAGLVLGARERVQGPGPGTRGPP